MQHVLKEKQGLTFRNDKGYQLDCYVDADFAGLWGHEEETDPVCVKSRTGYTMTLAGCPVHWVSKLQTTISTSTLEVEYVALSQATRELVPMRRLLQEIVNAVDPDAKREPAVINSTIFEDNNGATSTATSPNMTPRTKHMAVKCHCTRSQIIEGGGEVELRKIESENQKADILTKGLKKDDFERIRLLLCGW